MPEKMVKDLNTYLDELLKQDDRESLSGTLVGQIHRGEQLNMDPEHELLQEYCQFVTGLGASYVNTVMEQTGHALEKPRQIAVDEVWSVHSFEGDYNPIHDHGTKTLLWAYRPLDGRKCHSRYWTSRQQDHRNTANTMILEPVTAIWRSVMGATRSWMWSDCDPHRVQKCNHRWEDYSYFHRGCNTWFILSSGKVNGEQWHRT